MRTYPLEDDDEEDSVPGSWLTNLSPMLYTIQHPEFLFQSDADWNPEYPASVGSPRLIIWESMSGQTAEPQEYIRVVTAP
jgi:hypothetical protein